MDTSSVGSVDSFDLSSTPSVEFIRQTTVCDVARSSRSIHLGDASSAYPIVIPDTQAVVGLEMSPANHAADSPIDDLATPHNFSLESDSSYFFPATLFSPSSAGSRREDIRSLSGVGDGIVGSAHEADRLATSGPIAVAVAGRSCLEEARSAGASPVAEAAQDVLGNAQTAGETASRPRAAAKKKSVKNAKSKSKAKTKAKARGRPAATKEVLLNRERQRRHRAKSKIADPGSLTEQQRRFLDRLAQDRAPQSHYRKENVEWIVKVGTCPSAGGARAPLAGIISHVHCTVSRWTVERYRWRMHTYMITRETELWREYLGANAVGICLRFDETPMKLFIGGLGSQSSSILVRNVRAFDSSGDSMVRSPALCRPSGCDLAGILGAVDVRSLELGGPFLADDRWRVLLILTDGAAVNRSVARAITWQLRSAKRVLVLFSTCWAHHLSNSAKWSLGAFRFGSMLRLSHVMQAKRVPDVVDFCRRMLSVTPYAADRILESTARASWERLLCYVMTTSGPFSNRSTADRLCDEALVLFPAGPPHHDRQWNAPEGLTPSRYADFVDALFRRTIPTPIASRWYTVEQFCWFAYAMREFALVRHVALGATQMRYWPGDEHDPTDGQDENVASRNSQRLVKLQDYLSSVTFVKDVLVCCISSIPRWNMARAMEGEKAGSRGGVRSALQDLVADTVCILEARENFVELMLAREVDEETLRLYACRALLCTVLYLAEKHRPYMVPIWRAVRGELGVPGLVSGDMQRCCADHGGQAKINAVFDSVSGAEREAAMVSLAAAVNGSRCVYTAKGGCDNTDCERSLSTARRLGLKQPFRPPKLSTLHRETVNQFYLTEQKRWMDNVVQEALGNSQNLGIAFKGRKAPKYNAFSAFMHSMRGFATDCDVIWRRLGAESRLRWAELATRMNEGAAGGARAAPLDVKKLRAGPLGSLSPTCPVDAGEVYQALHADGATLPARWTPAELTALAGKLDRPAPTVTIAPDERLSIRGVLLPGDQCSACAGHQKEAVRTLAPLAASVVGRFETLGGIDVGLTVGVLYVGSVRWFEICCVMKKPLRILSIPLEITRDMAGYCEGVGAIRLPLAAKPLVPNVMDGRSTCLLDHCATIGDGLPVAAVYLSKAGSTSGAGGWAFLYGGERHVDRFDVAAAGSAAPAAPRAKAQPRAKSLYSEIFGDDAGDTGDTDGDVRMLDTSVDINALDLGYSSEEETGAAPAVENSPSDDELMRKIALQEDDRVEVTNRFRGYIDTSKYAVFASASRGIVTVFWKSRDKGDHRPAYLRARVALEQVDGARRLHASRSVLLSLYDMDTCIHRCALWQQWHAAWVYGTTPSLILPKSMPLPLCMVAPVVQGPGGQRRSVAEQGSRSPGESIDQMYGSGSESSRSNVAGDTQLRPDVDTSDIESTSEGTLSF